MDRQLKDALPRHDRWFDALKADFTTVLADMPVYLRDRLARALAEDHVIPWDLRNFIKALDDLREYRHWLEHADERIHRGERRPHVGDDRLIAILGLMLLPFLSAHLVGRIRHHGRRAGMRRQKVDDMANAAKQMIDSAIARRREASRFMNGLKRRTSNEDIAAELTHKRGAAPSDREVHKIAAARKKERADLEDRKKALLALHRRYFDDHTWPRYNLENFLIRFGFIGRARIAQLEQQLGVEDAARPDFINAIEPAFMLAMDMALIVHSWLADMEALGVPVRDRKSFVRKGRLLSGESEADRNAHFRSIVAIRNAIAHGGWLWAVADPVHNDANLTTEEVLTALLRLPERFAFNDVRQRQNDLLTRLEGALRPCHWANVYEKLPAGSDPNQNRPRYVVKRWTVDRRERFANRNGWRLEKRPALRRLAAAWMRDIATAQSSTSQKN